MNSCLVIVNFLLIIFYINDRFIYTFLLYCYNCYYGNMTQCDNPNVIHNHIVISVITLYVHRKHSKCISCVFNFAVIEIWTYSLSLIFAFLKFLL